MAARMRRTSPVAISMAYSCLVRDPSALARYVTTESSGEKHMESGAAQPGRGKVAMSSNVIGLSRSLGIISLCLYPTDVDIAGWRREHNERIVRVEKIPKLWARRRQDENGEMRI